MQYRKFGPLGWDVSVIGFGAWALGSHWGHQDDAVSVQALHTALDMGCNFIDTARAYGDGRSERIIAEALKTRSGERVYVASKIAPAPGTWPPSPYDKLEQRLPAKYVEDELNKSLRDLNTDCVDVMQIHTWTRAWNRHPAVFEQLARFKKQGKIAAVGISTPEHDQHAVVDLMRAGLVDSVQLIYNIFEQEPAGYLLPLAQELNIAVIVRVAFDESALTGKLTAHTQFAEDDFRRAYFSGDRLERTVRRVDKIKQVVAGHEPDMPTAALKFALKPAAVSTVIAGIRNPQQAQMNCAVGEQPPMSDELEQELRKHAWNRAFWYRGG
jgi:aryl-alcohol dehydrogenase-like predicted oxidoreductase